MAMKENGNISSEINSEIASVVFIVDGNTHRLTIPIKQLETGTSLFGNLVRYKLPAKVLGFELYFPATTALDSPDNLRDIWNKLVEYGFNKL